jgi:methylated-DNA-protein-cysteine methyltransferase-like protein
VEGGVRPARTGTATRPAGAARAPRPSRHRLRSDSPLPASRGAYPRVYEVVMRIPRGRVATYGQVAAEAGIPNAPRVAGYALHALPQGSPVPWHRVVAAGGRLSLGKLDPSGAVTQRLRLEHEGVRFDGRGCVDLGRHAWRPRKRAASRAGSQS